MHRTLGDCTTEVEAALQFSYEQRQVFDDWIKNVLDRHVKVPGETFCDEIAWMFDSTDHQREWMRAMLVTGQWAHTFAADDEVATWPIVSDYRVAYDFLTCSEDVDHPGFRLECMNIRAGGSPLHYALEHNSLGNEDPFGWGIAPVHASFKVHGGVDEYEACMAALRAVGCVPALYCSSTYGKFSYWRVPDDRGGSKMRLYLKPRVNLRDAS